MTKLSFAAQKQSQLGKFVVENPMTREARFTQLQAEDDFDVVILGGGINGACLFNALCEQGYRTLLLDKGDFASGTSQASGMMVWGGLLYLKNFDLRTVFHLSLDRDRMIAKMSDWISPLKLRYLPSTRVTRGKWLVYLALWAYWLIGLGARQTPGIERAFAEQTLLKDEMTEGALNYEEAFLRSSDARFVQHWIFRQQGTGRVAMNYCEADGAYCAQTGLWRFDLHDTLGGRTHTVTAKMVVNCAGVWTDAINARFGIESPYRHALSKGVYLGIRRPPSHETSLVVEMEDQDDVLMLVPWGPISMWGPTETMVQDVSEGFSANRADIDYLLDHYARRFRRPLARWDIVSVRCGIRPLVVDRDFHADCYPLELSRRQEVVPDRLRPWVSCYGGKLTGCTRMAERAMRLITGVVQPSRPPARSQPIAPLAPMELADFPEMPEPVPSPRWCREQEMCCTLEDYMRRRTNIAQWVPRMGLGWDDTNLAAVRAIALDLAGGDRAQADQLLAAFRLQVSQQVDDLLN